jgi:ribose transport system permease protein
MAIARNSSIIGMLALGMTFVIITGGIDLSAGHIVATAGAVLITLQANPDMPLPIAILGCIGVALAIGILSGSISTMANLPPFIVTLAIGIFFRSITTYAHRGTTILGRNVPEFTQIGMGNIGYFPIPFVIFLLSAILLSLVLKYTKFGSYVYAVGGNENAARYSGINVHIVKIGAYALLGLCIGITAVIDFGRTVAVTTTTSGYLYEFDAITAAVIGGTSLAGGRGRIIGTVMGVFIIGMVSNILIMLNLSPFLQGAVKGVIILVAVLLQKKDR